jgi:predicted dehydrogenase
MTHAGHTVRLGIVGLGMSHVRNAPTIPAVRVTAACDTDPARPAALAAAFQRGLHGAVSAAPH